MRQQKGVLLGDRPALYSSLGDVLHCGDVEDDP